ncbi:GM22786 [Drosophila sechellia]|uniref:GM22786 n=1 Tax=Drosophila sechellia TaxID=7238 RepID=B4I6W4_DROSE|nr:GM22786 [Drosophila sechellia]
MVEEQEQEQEKEALVVLAALPFPRPLFAGSLFRMRESSRIRGAVTGHASCRCQWKQEQDQQVGQEEEEQDDFTLTDLA